MLYMVIEHFKDGVAPEVYRRFRERGRMAPEGLRYVDSWVDLSFRRCFQVLRSGISMDTRLGHDAPRREGSWPTSEDLVASGDDGPLGGRWKSCCGRCVAR